MRNKTANKESGFKRIMVHKQKKTGKLIKREKVTAILCLALATVLLSMGSCTADSIVLPTGMNEIGDEAFAGDTSIQEAVIPSGVTSIGDRAFAGCFSLNKVDIPESLIHFGEDVFSGCGDALYLVCKKGSASAAWARNSGFDWSADTDCRALIIGNTYSGMQNPLEGPLNDMRAMSICLSQMKVTAWNAVGKSNLSGNEILEQIGYVFDGADEDDLSLFYFSGHGETGGNLVGNDGVQISPQSLRAAMDHIPGRKTVVVDACYSGALADDGDTVNIPVASANAVDGNRDSFADAFLKAFSIKRRGALTGGDYFVLVSSHPDEECWEQPISSGGTVRTMGVFSYYLCRGCGFDGVRYEECALFADVNGDGAVSLAEAFEYAGAGAAKMNPEQNAMVYPEGCIRFAPFRR